MRIGKDLVLWNFFMTKFCKKARQMGFFFTQSGNQGKNGHSKSWFSSFFCFFHFFYPAQKPQIWCRYRLKSDSLTFKNSLHSIERKKSWKNHFEHKIHWVFAGFEHKQRNIKLSYQNWNFDEKFWFSVLWEVLAGKFLMSFNFVKSWDLIQFCCTEVDTTLGLTSFEIL